MNNPKIAIIGLGYVGLPLAAAFASKYEVVGFDISTKRIVELNSGLDATNELTTEQLNKVVGNSLKLTTTLADISNCTTFIVTVPTPVTSSKSPDLTPVVKATESVSTVLKKGDTVVYESTVYPGVTEEVCVPILEEKTGLKFNVDFFVGYSPERINPGDKKHTITKITKVVSGSTPQTLKELSALYRSIIEAGIYEAPTIKTAEAAKVIENTQRDINIAFVNELSIIFSKMGIDTNEVLKAAGTKWNFLNFFPGLVGGHCIGVDPYYLAYKSEQLGYTPEMILAGRKINDSMPTFIVSQIVKQLLKQNKNSQNAKALILGATFKENCPDLRNSKVVDVYQELNEFGFQVDVFDPEADVTIFVKEYGFDKLKEISNNEYDVVILAVAHDSFKTINPKDLIVKEGVVFDVKGFYKDPDFLYL
ncbi:MAG: UDP-N-acetyl-D-galactosamine dehydrogenase [Candidatus Arcticimaribacter sp.]|jgi:UDP-N-acetyl-D-galactosamine dehydrogenase|nr:nucleotide sugar dehydrogenase [Flavobacteriaceae bacterium]